jgi:hypothetical protein
MDVGTHRFARSKNPENTPTHKKGSNRVATPAELDDDYTVMQYGVSIQLADLI